MNCNYMSNFNLLSLQFQFLYNEKYQKIQGEQTYLGVFRSYSREVHSFLKLDKGD